MHMSEKTPSSPHSDLWLQVEMSRPPGVMERHLEVAGFGLALLGWLGAILTRCVALWKVSGTLDNTTATLPAYWDGVWLEWDQWDLAHDGRLHCSFYQSLLSLSGHFWTWRALITAAIVTGLFAVVIGACGTIWFPMLGQIKAASGALFVLSGILLLIPTAWTCHHTSQPLEDAKHLRRHWGPALYFGWISFAFLLVGGVILTTRWPRSQGPVPPSGGNLNLSPEEDANHPLNRINRTAFTNSQYERRSRAT
ncbi:unnamed protein product [Tetraodon nigroviridis]|uniref:(spotted green pufferfish) hypothetical protein n=1 Tax=Tetraodon nigroviridis TaxID=99883 RepID=Q4RFU1_TETNG|nr:unnamed protein product [Tetraodon nigroviridis]